MTLVLEGGKGLTVHLTAPLFPNPGEVAENEKLLKSLLRAAYEESPEQARQSPAQIAMWPEGVDAGD